MLLFKQPLRGKNPVDLITVDSLIELQDSQNPFQYWIVSVVENVGGRLRLRYVGLEETESYDQWLFYLDCRLRPVGWCQENKYRMDPPAGKKKKKTLLKILFSFVIFFMTVVCFKILVQPTSFPAFTLLGQQVLTGTQIACKSHLIWVQSGSGKLY